MLAGRQDDKATRSIGFPYGPYAMGLPYNRDLFQKAGLDPDKPPTTWDEVAQDAKTISEKSGESPATCR